MQCVYLLLRMADHRFVTHTNRNWNWQQPIWLNTIWNKGHCASRTKCRNKNLPLLSLFMLTSTSCLLCCVLKHECCSYFTYFFPLSLSVSIFTFHASFNVWFTQQTKLIFDYPRNTFSSRMIKTRRRESWTANINNWMCANFVCIANFHSTNLW